MIHGAGQAVIPLPGATGTTGSEATPMAEKNPFFGATFAERKAARLAAEESAKTATKSVDADAEPVENKAVPAKKTATKRSRTKSA